MGCVSGRAEKTGAPCQPPACPGVRLRARLRSRCFKCGTLRLCSPVAKCWHQTRQREAVGLNPGSDNESLHTTQCLLTATILPLLTCYCLLCSPSTLTTVCSPRCSVSLRLTTLLSLLCSPRYCLCPPHYCLYSPRYCLCSAHHSAVSAHRAISAHQAAVCSPHYCLLCSPHHCLCSLRY